MDALELVLRRPTSRLKANLTRAVVVGATAAALVLTPALSTMAAPGSAIPAAPSGLHDESPKIVPATGPGSDEAEAEDEDLDWSEAENDDDVSDRERDRDEVDQDFDDENDGESPTLTIDGIIPSQADLRWDQWTGAMDARLTAPFITLPQPVQIRSEAIDLDAAITVREIVNGEMQTPKDEVEVSWYKETGSPGEPESNMVFAGHLNWYNTPEAVFHAIDELEEGDEIVVTAEDGNDYTYVVTWVELVETADADMEALFGPTDEPSLTLITCGGEWDPAVSQYKQRTVVRAELQP